MTDILEELLINTTDKIKYFESEKEKWLQSGKFFNMLNITGINSREVYMCKLLAEILNPEGLHAQKKTYLDLFCEKFFPNLPIKTDKVKITLEVSTNELDKDRQQRRIDIVIDDDFYYIPIEVKINASELENQCQDYLKQAYNVYRKRKVNHTPIMLFLTKDGHLPKSIEKEKSAQVTSISWKDICEWLQLCIEQSEKLKCSQNIINTLEQYKSAIEEFLESPGDKLMIDIEKLLINNEDYMKSAEVISNTIDNAYKTLWTKFTNKIKENYNCSTYHDDDTRLAYEFKKIDDERTECKVFDIYNLKKKGIDKLFATYDNNRSYIEERNRTKLCHLSELADSKKFDEIIIQALDFLKNND